MILGNPLSFAVEVDVESGPKFMPVVGGNVAGRMRLHVGGLSIGDIDEPSCVLRALSEHLVQVCLYSETLWHPLLAGLGPKGQFELLDKALFLGGGNPQLEQCHRMIFLTNVSEAFDPVKGFVISPAPNEVLALLRLNEDSPVIHRTIPSIEFCSVAADF